MVGVTLTDFILVPQFVSFYITDSNVFQTEIGPIDVESKRRFVNFMAYLTIPIVNQLLLPGFRIPDTLLGFIRVKDATFDAKDGYLAIGIVP